MKYFLTTILLLVSLLFLDSCNHSKKEKTSNNETTISKNDSISENSEIRNLSNQFKAYWFSGKAEITSYQLSQERYGELRKGTTVNIFVSEDFLANEQVKADGVSKNNIPVLKLNNTKNFITGIYPYSIMNSTFSPLKTKEHPIKLSTSTQEWCGQMYMQLNNKEKFNIISHSYFEGQADNIFSLEKTWLETEVWNLIRINPKELPLGTFNMIPSFEYLRLKHKETKAYLVEANLKTEGAFTIYTIKYPNLPRTLSIYFNTEFPYGIEKWEESNSLNPNDLKTTAVKIKSIRTAYWSQNKNKNLVLRDSLGL